MYPSYYFPDLSEQEMADNRNHNEHCIDTLRQSIMCHADTTPATMRWDQTQKLPIINVSSPHECVNWASINGWARQRSVDTFEPGYLIHPKFGAVFDEDEDADDETGLGHYED